MIKPSKVINCFWLLCGSKLTTHWWMDQINAIGLAGVMIYGWKPGGSFPVAIKDRVLGNPTMYRFLFPTTMTHFFILGCSSNPMLRFGGHVPSNFPYFPMKSHMFLSFVPPSSLMLAVLLVDSGGTERGVSPSEPWSSRVFTKKNDRWWFWPMGSWPTRTRMHQHQELGGTQWDRSDRWWDFFHGDSALKIQRGN